ncbi:amidohydrolase family protein [Achromobacter aloeverae]|uniref:Amidohydrolase n=1 Tax=Achromobacter aloeverae TaxID=1750518 RepID=A0A4Q1HFD5_9BURK|nr:amidohydrolase family protein [Achromobacter aloeverae]RXN85350.1 amidohydrolase [Achromobacter aloeverae]
MPEHDIWDCHTHIFGPWADFPLPESPTYQPDAAPYAELRALHARCGITRGVIVQATPYRDDHGALLAALQASAGAYRGIALIDLDTSEETLDSMHRLGVRGIRLGMMKHLAGALDLDRMRALLQRIRPYGWHALVHADLADVLAAVPALAPLGVPLIIDHMGRIPVHAAHDPAPLLRLLDDPGVWMKISGADRVTGGRDGYQAALPLMRRLIARAPDRILWGTDWPHVNIAYARPRVEALYDLLRQACADTPQALTAILGTNPARLYG